MDVAETLVTILDMVRERLDEKEQPTSSLYGTNRSPRSKSMPEVVGTILQADSFNECVVAQVHASNNFRSI
jgi:hypothetical protein